MFNNSKKLKDNKIIVSDEARKNIFEYVENCYKSDVVELIDTKKCWRTTGITFETLSKITVAVGGVLSFSSGYFNSNILSFISGSVSVISLALLQFSTFANNQSKKRANDLNVILNKLDLQTIPIFDEIAMQHLSSGNERKGFGSKGLINNNDYSPVSMSHTNNNHHIFNNVPSISRNVTIMSNYEDKSFDNINKQESNNYTVDDIKNTENMENMENVKPIGQIELIENVNLVDNENEPFDDTKPVDDNTNNV